MAKLGGRFAILILGLWLSACTQSIVAEFSAPGAFTVADAAAIEIPAPADGQAPLSLRVIYPRGQGPWPLIVYSHGTFANNMRYDRIVMHWASHGFVVVLPQHLDANRGVPVRSYADMEAVIHQRAEDMRAVLDLLPQIMTAVPALGDKIGPPPYVAAGHSVGSYVALLAAGLETRNPQTGEVMAHGDARYGLVVMSSDPGNMALMPADLWLGVSVPRFLVRGSEDFGQMGKGRADTSYETEITSRDEGAAGSRFLLEIAGADHYFGGLVHKQPKDVSADHQGLQIFNMLSTAFLVAHLQGDRSAMRALRNLDWQKTGDGRAVLRNH